MNFSKGEMLVITGMAAMVEEEGKTPHEAMEIVRVLEKQIFHALMDLHKEAKHESN